MQIVRRNDWFYACGQLAADGWQAVVDTSIEGWHHTGLRIAELGGDDDLALPGDLIERIVVPLAGTFQLYSEDVDVTLVGRSSVFDGPTDVFYLGVGASAVLRGQGRVAIAEAPATRTFPSRYIHHDEVAVELRGAGRSSRQVHNFGTPANLEADRFIVCEVITPAENWSSYPPHKHDTLVPGMESRLEEIYYFETAVSRGLAAPADADPFGYARTYSSEAGEIDTIAEVHTGDIALVPFGWHGPCVAAPGYDLYYLNVMAGPDADRVWNITDDPTHGWIRGTWDGQAFDARLPYERPATGGNE